jgi:tetratricopeptide (TPR) repeat protein
MSELLSCAFMGVIEFLLMAVDPVAAAEPERTRRFDGLGTHGRVISTSSPDSQTHFNEGLAFLYAFNHDEAIRSFRRAALFEPRARMAWEALEQAQKLSTSATPVERELIAALSKRYANPQPEDRRPLDEAYAEAMRKVWESHPDDADIGALYAEALMDLQPWNQWSPEGIANDGTDEVLKTLDRVLALNPKHPLALHLYIHAVETSPSPEKAVEAADRLRDLQSGLGHMVHMPSHIDVRLGKWQRAIEANEKAIVADTAYRAAHPDQDFYRIYMAHNHHMLAFAAMMQGQRQRSTHAIRVMLAEMPPDWVRNNAPFVDAFHAMPYELALRFGQWDELLAEPEPPEHFPVTRAVRLYARGVAYAAKDQVDAARTEQRQFRAIKSALPAETMFTLNTAADILNIADRMLEGEILYREGRVGEALSALREAVRREDALRYIEPPDWIQPVRHALGATLMDARRFAEAEAVYRDDLKKYPENGWSLFGLAESLRAQGKSSEADVVELRFKSAWQRADVKLTSSCYCLPGKK